MKELFIVTGSSGLLGNNLVRKLLELQKKVRVLLLPNEKISGIDQSQVEVVYGDVRDIESLKPLFKRQEKEKLICIHCAGIITISNKNDNRVYDVNVNGTQNIVNLCKEHKVEKLIYVSSVHAITEKPNKELIREIDVFEPDKLKGVYSKTKAMATNIVLDSAKEGLNACVVHPSGIIGPNDYYTGNFTELIISFLKNKLPVIVSGGYDFVDVRDVCDGIISAVDKGRKGECYILSNKFYSVKELTDTLAKITNKKPIKSVIPRWFIVPLAPLAELYYKLVKKKPLFTAYSLYVLESNANFSHEKATKELNYHPRCLDDTLKTTVDWLKEHNYA